MGNAIKATGTVIKIGDGGAPESFTTIGEIVSWDGPNPTVDTIDTTTLADGTRTFIAGLKDGGEFSAEFSYYPGDTGQDQLYTDMNAGTLRNFQIVLTDTGTTTGTFAAVITALGPSGSMGEKVVGKLTLKVSGATTWA